MITRKSVRKSTWRVSRCCPLQYWTPHLLWHTFCELCHQTLCSSSRIETEENVFKNVISCDNRMQYREIYLRTDAWDLQAPWERGLTMLWSPSVSLNVPLKQDEITAGPREQNSSQEIIVKRKLLRSSKWQFLGWINAFWQWFLVW